MTNLPNWGFVYKCNFRLKWVKFGKKNHASTGNYCCQFMKNNVLGRINILAMLLKTFRLFLSFYFVCFFSFCKFSLFSEVRNLNLQLLRFLGWQDLCVSSKMLLPQSSFRVNLNSHPYQKRSTWSFSCPEIEQYIDASHKLVRSLRDLPRFKPTFANILSSLVGEK